MRHPYHYDLGGNLTAYGQQKLQERRDRTPVTQERIDKAHADALRFERRCSIWEMEEADAFLLECAR
jgi:hypothetical protein